MQFMFKKKKKAHAQGFTNQRMVSSQKTFSVSLNTRRWKNLKFAKPQAPRQVH